MPSFTQGHAGSSVTTITPDLAREMLATSVGNRTMRAWYITLLAGAMRRGEWRETSQGIGFDKEGHLRDGHHRLHACIESGISFRSVVVFGLPVNAYEVIDTGMMRTYADRIGEERAVTDVYRLAVQIATHNMKPTVDQMRPYITAGLGEVARGLIAACSTKRRFYSAAPMKLAACINIMEGENKSYVHDQYTAMCKLDFPNMSPAAQALVRQVDSGKANGSNTRETLARGMRVFDSRRHDVTRIQVSAEDIDSAVGRVRTVLRESVARNMPHLHSSKGPSKLTLSDGNDGNQEEYVP